MIVTFLLIKYIHFLQLYYKYYKFVTSNDWYHIMYIVFCQLFYLLIFEHTDYTVLFFVFIIYFSLLFHCFLSFPFTITHHRYDQKYRNPDCRRNRNNIWCPVISTANLYKVSGKQFSLQTVHEGKSAGREDTP